MSPDEAILVENKEKVLKNAEKYGKEFKRKELPSFKVSDIVLVQNENKRHKMDDEFSDKGKIEEVVSKDTYVVKLDKGSFSAGMEFSSVFARGMLGKVIIE